MIVHCFNFALGFLLSALFVLFVIKDYNWFSALVIIAIGLCVAGIFEYGYYKEEEKK